MIRIGLFFKLFGLFRIQKAKGADMMGVSPKIVSRHTVDTSSLRTVVAALIKPTMTSEEKALAIWRFCWEHTYHWPAPREALMQRPTGIQKPPTGRTKT